MRQERLAANHKQAEEHKNALGATGSTTQMKPGPQDMDNRFFQTGTRSLAGGRSAPQYSFGSISELAAPRYVPGMEVELLGRDSPGPGTATAKIASVGGQLEKTTAARKVPVFGFGKSTNERVQPRVQETAGPADTVCDRKVLEFTRLKRTPAASFASPTDTELFKSSSAASLHGLVGLLHPSRTPGPGTYVIKNQIEGNSGTTIRPEPQPSPQPEPQPEPEPQPQP